MTITPDASYCHRQLGRRFAERTVNYDPALLQSCQQAHDEATATLCDQKSSTLMITVMVTKIYIKIEASAYCWYRLGKEAYLRTPLQL